MLPLSTRHQIWFTNPVERLTDLKRRSRVVGASKGDVGHQAGYSPRSTSTTSGWQPNGGTSRILDSQASPRPISR